MSLTRNCHRLLNKLCGTVEQRDIFASGIAQQRPHTSSCAKLGLVIVFQPRAFLLKGVYSQPNTIPANMCVKVI